VNDRFDLLMTLVADQAPALFDINGLIFEGHVQSCLAGEVVAVARPYGTRDVRQEYRWCLEEIRDIDLLVEAGADELEDPLIEQARDLAARAQEYDGLSLAERLLADRYPREPHVRSSHL
jgi:hypothetical protein